MFLKVQVTKDELCAVVKLDGRVMLGEESSLLRDTARAIIASGQPRLVFDVSDVTYVDSTGLTTLYAAVGVWAKNAGGEAVFVNPQKKVLDLLQITKLLTIAQIFATTSEAIEYFRKKVAQPRTQAENARPSR